MALILPSRYTQQPQGLVSLAPRFFEKSALCFLPNSLHLSNLARSNAGKVLTRVAPTLKTTRTGRGVGCSSTTRSYLDTDWIAPIQTSASDGTGAFSLLLSATMASAAGRTFPFNIRLNGGIYTSVLIVQNGYYAPGGTSSIFESGTVWIGYFDGTVGARGARLTGVLSSAQRAFTLLFERFSDGTSKAWLDGALVFSESGSYPTPTTTGTAQLLSIGGNSVSDGFATPDPIHLLYAANDSFTDAESASISRNPWQIFNSPKRDIWAGAGGASDHSLTANGITTATPALDTPALTQGHALTTTTISTSAATLGTPALSQGYPLAANGITTATPALDTPALTQDHVVAATAISTSVATLGNPALSGSDAYNLTADSISTSAATLGTPSLTQDHAMGAGAIAAGSPTFGPVTLEQQHALLADGITTSAATLGNPLLSGELFTAEQLAYLLSYMQENLMIPTAEEVAAAVLAAMNLTPPAVDTQLMNGYEIVGTGQENDKWRANGVPA